jgi:hypothetical protein
MCYSKFWKLTDTFCNLWETAVSVEQKRWKLYSWKPAAQSLGEYRPFISIRVPKKYVMTSNIPANRPRYASEFLI